MSLKGKQNTVGANILKRLVGSETSIDADFDNRSSFFEGHEMRMRYHAKRVEIGQREEDRRLTQLAKEKKDAMRTMSH